MSNTQADKLDTTLIAAFGVIATLGTFVIGVILQVIFLTIQDTQRQVKDINQPWREVEDLRHQELAELQEYSWVSKENNKVRIPISQAKNLVLDELTDQELLRKLRTVDPNNPQGMPTTSGASNPAPANAAPDNTTSNNTTANNPTSNKPNSN